MLKITNPFELRQATLPEIGHDMSRVLSHEIDENYAAVLALKHVWGMDTQQVADHTGFSTDEVTKLEKKSLLAVIEHYGLFQCQEIQKNSPG